LATTDRLQETKKVNTGNAMVTTGWQEEEETGVIPA